jgi:hypothetical protein
LPAPFRQLPDTAPGAEKLAMIERGVRGRTAFAANKFASIFIA